MAVTQTQELEIVIKGVGAEKVQQSIDKIGTHGIAAGGQVIKAFGVKALAQMDLFRRGMDLVGTAVRAGVDELKTMVTAGMAAADIQGELNVIFDDQMAIIADWAESSGAAMYDTQLAVEDYAGSVFLLAENLGLSEEAAINLSMSTVDLAADMAEFYEIEGGTAAAVNMLNKALAGKYKGLVSCGIVIDAGMVKAEAYRMGLVKEGEQVDKATMAQAAMNLIMQQTAPALGEVARSSGDVHVQMANIKARIQDAREQIGAMIISAPGLTDAMSEIAEGVKTAAERLMEFVEREQLIPQLSEKAGIAISALTDIIEGKSKAWNDFAAAIGTVAVALGWVASLVEYTDLAQHPELINGQITYGGGYNPENFGELSQPTLFPEQPQQPQYQPPAGWPAGGGFGGMGASSVRGISSAGRGQSRSAPLYVQIVGGGGSLDLAEAVT